MKRVLAAAFLLGCLAGGARAAEVSADAETVKLVRFFIKTPTAELPPELVEAFLAVKSETLPKKLRRPYEAKKLELYTLKQLAVGKNKGDYRITAEDCSAPKEGRSQDAALLKQSGYVEIEEDEEQYLIDKTHCSQQKQMCEFTLQIIVETAGRRIVRRRYFLHGKDPLMALVSEYRASKGHRNTNFFGLGSYPTCAQ